MARSIWSGFLSFGLVSVPVGLFSATRDQGVHFNQFEKGTADRIRYKKVNERTGEEVAAADIVRGMDLGGGEYVIVTNEELKNIAPGRSETIEISDFVALDEIDPLYFQSSYYLAPRGKGADRAYGLLRQAMLESKRVGLATLVMRDKQYLVAVRPAEDVLVLETMYFAEQVRDPAEELDSLPEAVKFDGRELDVAKQLIESLSVAYDPERYHDEYHERIEALIEEKRQGRSLVYEPERPVSNVVNLMDALQASIAKVRGTAVEASVEEVAEAAPAKRARKAVPKAAEEVEAGAPHEQQHFEGMTKADLLTRAAELEVEGRSKMSKDELVVALRERTAGGNRSRKVS
ncbi:MAG TPA: Ku protein [Acidimicrobiales bacterium]|nr:Ku protein [Acidimicrobiales bacterium]